MNPNIDKKDNPSFTSKKNEKLIRKYKSLYKTSKQITIIATVSTAALWGLSLKDIFQIGEDTKSILTIFTLLCALQTYLCYRAANPLPRATKVAGPDTESSGSHDGNTR